MANDETTIRLPVEVPNLKSKEELKNLIAQKEAELADYKDTLRMLVYTTEFDRIKNPQQSVIQFLDGNLSFLIGAQNNLGRTEALLVLLKSWLNCWDTLGPKPVKGFREFAENPAPADDDPPSNDGGPSDS